MKKSSQGGRQKFVVWGFFGDAGDGSQGLAHARQAFATGLQSQPWEMRSRRPVHWEVLFPLSGPERTEVPLLRYVPG
jgi:hypothetical protein